MNLEELLKADDEIKAGQEQIVCLFIALTIFLLVFPLLRENNVVLTPSNIPVLTYARIHCQSNSAPRL